MWLRKAPRSRGASPPPPSTPQLPAVPSGRCHDAAALLLRCLFATAVGVVAEAEAVAYLVGHGGCCANGKLRVVLGWRGDGHCGLRGSPARSTSLPLRGGAHPAHASRTLSAAHTLYGRQAHSGTPEGAAPKGGAPGDWEEPGVGAARGGVGARVGVGGTHVSSCAESCGRRAHSPRRHCRKAHSVAFASGVMRLWSCSVHTSRPVSAT